MIEAVNSVVANASLLRQSAQQAVSTQASAEIESVASFPLAPYIDQISVDTNFDTAVLEIRDPETGDVLSQFPAETTLEARQRAEAVRQRAELLRQTQDSGSQGPSSSDGLKPQGQSFGSVSAQAAAIVANQAPQQSLGAGEAKAAVIALSTGAQAGQAAPSNISVTA